MAYDPLHLEAPRLTGASLAATVALVENPITAVMAAPELLRRSGIGLLRQQVLSEAPCVAPPLPRSGAASAVAAERCDLRALVQRESPPRGFRFESVADYARAYRDGTADPSRVAEALLAALARVDAGSIPLRAITAYRGDELRAQARASGERHRKGAALSVLDGVPIAVKEEFDVAGHATTAGTAFLREVARDDATIVARLRAAGALIYGKANMHEIGIDVTGFNRAHGTARNPYELQCYAGGSSSGSAAAVAAGLGPIALAADGGGSIRIPSALCGVVGLKPTWSRVSEAGAYPLCWSVTHAGPIGATARDVAIAYATIAGPDARDPSTYGQPGVHLDGVGEERLEGLRLGIYEPWFEHAQPEIVRACRELVERLVARGAGVVPVEIPDLELARMAHGVSILSEMASSPAARDGVRAQLCLSTRLMLALGRATTARDYVIAQQVRRQCFANLQRAFERCDAILTPATARVAPRIRADVLPRGEHDLAMTSALMRFVYPANLTGHPAISFPAGYDAAGLPIGIQAIGRPWEEHVLLRLAHVTELEVERRSPRLHQCLLQ